MHKVGRQGTLKPKAVLVTGKFMYVLDCDTLRLRAKVPIQVRHWSFAPPARLHPQ